MSSILEAGVVMQSKKRQLFFTGLGMILGLSILVVGSTSFFAIKYLGKIYPGVSIGPIEVGGLSLLAAKTKVEKTIDEYVKQWPVTFIAADQSVTYAFPQASVTYDIDQTLNNAYMQSRLFPFFFRELQVPIQFQSSEFELQMAAASIAAEVDIPTIPVHLEVKSTGSKKEIVAIPGQQGRTMDQTAWIDAIQRSLSTLKAPEKNITFHNDSETLTEEQIQRTVDRANKLLSKKIILTVEPNTIAASTWTLSGEDIIKFISFDDGYDQALISEYVQGIAETANQPPKNAKFQFDENSGKVNEFAPAEAGIKLIINDSTAIIMESLNKLVDSESIDPVSLAVEKTQPEVSLEQINRLGIKEQLGLGVSTYHHSILTRVHNVELAAARLNGHLIKPGEEFSFNAAVGEVSGATGYQAAYVIRDGRTQLGDGGGLCQDSTTVFRAALDAGLPITVRRGHSYRVGYYEQNAKAGLDATVYSPSTDFKFMNDTPAHILIQTVVDSPNRTLKVYFYGTSDGRKSSITDHVVWGITPPLPDVNIEDPTLPAGVVKQIDWSAGGAKAKFTYTVVRGDQTIFEKTFLTNYQPWAAVYLRGTKTN